MFNIKPMQKKDVLFAFIIGEICAFIFIPIARFLGFSGIVMKLVMFFPALLPILAIAGLVLTALLGKKWPSFFQAGKNILVGILNSSIDFAVLNLLMFFFARAEGAPILAFKLLSFTSGAINSYFWNKFWTFGEKSEVRSSQFAKFYSVALGGLLIHTATIFFTVNVVGAQCSIEPAVWANIGNAAAIFLGFFWDFLGYKFLVFKK